MHVRKYVLSALVSGLLVVAPIYVVLLVLLKAINSLRGLVRPLARLVPDWIPADGLFSLLLVLVFCFLIGVWVRTRVGRTIWDDIERSVFQRLPGYTSLRGLAHQLAGDPADTTWKPALVEIEEALVPAFIIEELADGRFTVFVPSVPTPLAGALYVLSSSRVHPVDVSVTQTIRAISQWGSGSKDLVAAMEKS